MNLESDLVDLGVAPSSILMVHASMRAVGARAEELVAALLAALGPQGTLLAYVDYQVTPDLPRFDLRKSPASSEYGVLPEVIRRWPGAVRSRNPGGSMAAVGARAPWLCGDHPLSYGYGPGSPLAKLVEADGAVLLLGSDPDQVTLLHYADHLARLPAKRISRQTVATTEGEVEIEEFETGESVVAGMPEHYFAEVTQAFIDSGSARQGRVGGADSTLLPAAAFTRFAIEKMEREFG